MSKRRYTSEEAYTFLSMTDESDGDSSLSESGSEYEPVHSSGTLTDSSEDEDEVPVTARRTRPRFSVADMQEPQDSRMEQRASTSAATPSGELASTSGLVHPGRRRTSTAVQRGDVASPISAVQAGVASRSSPPQPQRRQRQARRARSALPAELSFPNWQPPTGSAPVLPPFTAQPGITVNTADFTPLDFYSLYFTDDLYNLIVDQTNLYASQYIASFPQSSFARSWRPTTVPEFKVFLGLTLLMGLDDKCELRSYWSVSPIYYTPMFSAIMTRARYEQIMRFMHFNDNELCLPECDPEFDRLYKIRPLVNHFNERFTALYIPNQVVCVDESLVKFLGRLGFRQYMPSKRARYGVKMYKLCDRATGYTCRFRVYEGKDSRIEPEGCPDYMGSSGKIVWELVSPLSGKGYHVYVDNFYSSVPLFSHLSNNSFGACGTVRPNRRGFPPRLVDARISRGERACFQSGNLIAVKWRDKRNVFVLSSIHTDTTVQIRTATGVVEKPRCVHDYNLYMGGVDLNDQKLAPYLVSRKVRRWYKKVSVYFFQLALLNAHVLYRASGQRMRLLKFQESIVIDLLYPDGAPLPLPNLGVVSRLHERHYPYAIPRTPTGRAPQKRCRVCRRRGYRSDTRFHCPFCPDQPGLCIGACFDRYHSLVNY